MDIQTFISPINNLTLDWLIDSLAWIQRLTPLMGPVSLASRTKYLIYNKINK